MQHYIKIGLGFSADLLTEEQAQLIWNEFLDMPNSSKVGLWLFPFTEDYEGKDWATIVIKNYGEIDNAGKMASIEDLTTKASQISLSKEEEKFIKEKFAEFGIFHLFSKIKPIIYSKMY